MSAVTKAVKKVFKTPTKSGKTVVEEIKDGPETAAEKVAKREAASMGAERAAALRSRRRGYRSLLSPDREDQQGLGNKLGG
jgi:hypothetical protein